LASSKSLDKYIDKLVERYSSLFTLPSGKVVILLLLVACLVGGTLTMLPVSFSFNGLVVGLSFGAATFFISFLSDILTVYFFMRGDPIFNLRRCSAVSLFSSSIWFAVTLMGSVFSIVLNNSNIWLEGFLLGFCTALVLRLLVFLASSFAGQKRIFVSSFFQLIPTLFLVFFLDSTVRFSLGFPIAIFLSIAVPVAILTVLFFVFLLDRVGVKTLGIPSFRLLKAFLASWIADLVEPFEVLFEKLGSERDIRVSMLVFGSHGKTKAIIVVPSLHPGPIKNLGSSLLPSMIQNALEKKHSCIVSVPHALYGHDFDLASQLQNQKILKAVLGDIGFSIFKSNGTQFVQTVRNDTSASCQLFGDCALLTLTVAPKTTEDFPEELDFVIGEEAKKHGLQNVIVVNAHNSIDGPFDVEKATDSLKGAAAESLKKAIAAKPFPFAIGAAKIVPEEFSIEEGMGPGGISVIVVKIGDQITAYVTIDGNNMVSGLREKVLSALNEIGISTGEVLTTDTHAVATLLQSARGYHPVGEVIDHTKLIRYIKEIALEALNNLEPADVSWRTTIVPKVKVIGRKQIEKLSLLTEETYHKARKLALLLFSTLGAFLVLFSLVIV